MLTAATPDAEPHVHHDRTLQSKRITRIVTHQCTAKRRSASVPQSNRSTDADSLASDPGNSLKSPISLQPSLRSSSSVSCADGSFHTVDDGADSSLSSDAAAAAVDETLLTPPKNMPPLQEEDSYESYLERMRRNLSKRDLGLLLGKNHPFCQRLLTAYANSYDFVGLPHDMALRRFLHDMVLPGEAGDIDRVVSGFAARYVYCNQDAFKGKDTAYILAFSMIMLNTDLHNPNVKRKMTRLEFIRNNRGIDNGESLPEAELSRIYSCIKRNPFRLTEDETPIAVATVDRHLTAKSRWTDLSEKIRSTRRPRSATMAQQQQQQQEKVKALSSLSLWPMRRNSSSSFASVKKEKSMKATQDLSHLFPVTQPSSQKKEVIRLEGYVWRKNDTLHYGEKQATLRRWRHCFVRLQGRYLLFYKVIDGRKSKNGNVSDTVLYLRSSHSTSTASQQSSSTSSWRKLWQKMFPNEATPSSASLYVYSRPEALITVVEAFAVHAHSYKKRENVLRLVTGQGHAILLQTGDALTCQQWIDAINAAAAEQTFPPESCCPSAADPCAGDVEEESVFSANVTLPKRHASFDGIQGRSRRWTTALARSSSTGHLMTDMEQRQWHWMSSNLQCVRQQLDRLGLQPPDSLDSDVALSEAVLVQRQQATAQRILRRLSERRHIHKLLAYFVKYAIYLKHLSRE